MGLSNSPLNDVKWKSYDGCGLVHGNIRQAIYHIQLEIITLVYIVNTRSMNGMHSALYLVSNDDRSRKCSSGEYSATSEAIRRDIEVADAQCCNRANGR